MARGAAPHTHMHTPLGVIKNQATRARAEGTGAAPQFLKTVQKPGAGPGRKSK